MIKKNKKVNYDYHIIKVFTAGISLQGWEVKSIRDTKVEIVGSYCNFINNELYITNMNITNQQIPDLERRVRKLLLNRSELNRISKLIKIKGYTVVPRSIFINDKGLIKLEICVVKGKNKIDKRNTIKERDIKRKNKY